MDKITQEDKDRWNMLAERFRHKPGFMDIGLKKSIYFHEQKGYVLTVKDMCEILCASRLWVEKNFVPYVKHIFLPVNNALIYYSKKNFWEYYSRNAQAFIQETPPVVKTFKYIAKRSEYPWHQVRLPKIGKEYILGKPIKEYVNEGAKSREAILRQFFVDGAIKINLFGKVYWVDLELEKQKRAITTPSDGV